jgi:hypothetical protein
MMGPSPGSATKRKNLTHRLGGLIGLAAGGRGRVFRGRDHVVEVGRVIRNAPLLRNQLVGGLGITRPTIWWAIYPSAL